LLPGSVAPDYTLPDPTVFGPFFNPNANNISISFSGSGDSIAFTGASLPKNGTSSLTDTNLYGPQNLVVGTNSPTNFNNQSGSVNLVPEHTSILIAFATYGLFAKRRCR
jgi:hypothetical protein